MNQMRFRYESLSDSDKDAFWDKLRQVTLRKGSDPNGLVAIGLFTAVNELADWFSDKTGLELEEWT